MAIYVDELGNEIEVPDTSQNQVNDDAGLPSDSNNPNVQAQGNSEIASPSVTDAVDAVNNGVSTPAKSGTNKVKSSSLQNKSPTARPNPLGYFSSYTYQLTLYMLTADAVNAFRASGRKNINNLVIKTQGTAGVSGGAYVVCQSGGVNNTTSPRAPGFNLDFYMDNLQIVNLVSPNESMSPTVSTRLNFTITEPYGFSFLSKLKFAADEIEKYSRTLNASTLDNASRQYFVLGVRFLGYDQYGNLMTGKETINGRVLDPAGTSNGTFETFYDILFKKVTFKIDGKSTVYNIEAVSVNADTLSIKNNIIPTQVTIEAGTVEEALTGKTGLVTLLNNYWNELVDSNKLDIGFKFKVEYVGDLNDLRNASLVLPEDTTKWKWPIKRDPNDPAGIKAIPDSNKRMISFSNTPSMTITSAIEKIISQSSFLSNALKVSYTNDVEPDAQTGDESEVKPDSVKYFRWFNITTNSRILGYSKNLNDWVYEITFVLSPYETPIVISPYAKQLPNYYGPVKRYDYWFTGENTEVISYEQQNNNGYFIVALDPSLDESSVKQTASANIPQRPNFQQNVDHTGKLFAGSEAIGSITTNLYDPKSYSNAKITILGDPDFLVQDSLNYDVATKTFNQFYAPNGTTINPTGGQIFVEVNFKEGVDYNYNTGLMDINDSITFWQYPESIKKIVKGVSFQVKKITSYFRGGKFTQDLDMFINQFGPDDTKVVDTNAREQDPTGPGGQRNANGSVATADGSTTSTNNGLKEDSPVAETTPPVTEEPSTSPDDPGTTQSTSTEEDMGREE